MQLKGSKTEKNLLTAFAGESQARNRYTYFASVANKEGYKQIAAIFEETANQEKEHAKRIFKFLEGGDVEVVAAFPAGVIGTTVDNLQAAADGEDYEVTEMYPGFAKVAKEEGFDEIAAVLTKIAKAEEHHRDRFLKLKQNIVDNKVFSSNEPTEWVCRNCGYIHTGNEAPKLCPACAHAQAHFEIKPVNY